MLLTRSRTGVISLAHDSRKASSRLVTSASRDDVEVWMSDVRRVDSAAHKARKASSRCSTSEERANDDAFACCCISWTALTAVSKACSRLSLVDCTCCCSSMACCCSSMMFIVLAVAARSRAVSLSSTLNFQSRMSLSKRSVMLV